MSDDWKLKLGEPDSRGVYRYADGSKIWKACGEKKFVAQWSDGTPLKEPDEKNPSIELISRFDSPIDALKSLYECQEGPFNPDFIDEPKPEMPISKRELIAAMAMQGLLSSSSEMGTVWVPKFLAKIAVDFADALLKETSK